MDGWNGQIFFECKRAHEFLTKSMPSGQGKAKATPKAPSPGTGTRAANARARVTSPRGPGQAGPVVGPTGAGAAVAKR